MVGQVIRNLDYVPLSKVIQLRSSIGAVVPISNYYSGQTATALANIWAAISSRTAFCYHPFQPTGASLRRLPLTAIASTTP